MNEEQATICRELAEAMGIGDAPYINRKGKKIYVKRGEHAYHSDLVSGDFFTDWTATGALMEWWLSDDERGISEQKRVGNGTYMAEVRFVRYETDSTYYYKVAHSCESSQEAIVRAIYAAVKARRGDGEKSEP